MDPPQRGHAPEAASPERPAGELSRQEQAVLYVVMLLSPLLLLGAAEGVLRLVGYGDSYPLFVPVEEREGYLYQNRDVARRYFANLESIPSSLLDFFPAAKAEGTFRIFVQGGSSAAGFPFYYGGAFSRMLEQRLAQTYPDRRIEVVNTSMAAISSYTLLDLVPEILAQQPDAILIYAGHNEYYGALGVGSSESLGRSPIVKRAYLQLRRMRVVQGLRDLLAHGASLLGGRRKGEIPHYTLMSQMVGEQRIRYGSPLYEAGLTQFRSNLSRMLSRYREEGIPVFVATVASNERDHRPFIGTPGGAALELYESGMQALGRGDLENAVVSLTRAVEADPEAADPWFALGKIHEQQGALEEARAAYLAAKDRDELRFRAPEAINQIIRDLASRHGAVVVDARAVLAEESSIGMVGDELMTEHLHPNVDGYFLIADAFYEQVVASGLLGSSPRSVPRQMARREVLLTPVDSLAGMLRIRKLKATWPFQPPGIVDRSLDTLTARNTIEQIAIDLTENRISWYQGNEALRRYYEERGDLHGALKTALAQIQEFPLIDAPYLVAGNLLMRQQRYDEALAYFENALAVEESARAHRMIGSIMLSTGNRADAIAHLERSVALDPEDVAAIYNLAGAYALERRYDEARRLGQRALALAPNHADARKLLNSLPAGQ